MIDESSPSMAADRVSPSVGDDMECGLAVSAAGDEAETQKPHRSRMEEDLVRNALSFMKSTETKWCDARGQSGPSPADFGEHDPIPVDAICASVVVSTNKES
jgi:hypothetical protein